MKRFIAYWHTHIVDTWRVFVWELKHIFRDPGVALIFFGGGLLYPILYNLIYIKNVVQEVPVAVVDMSGSKESREFIFNWDATPEVQVCYSCISMEEAQHLLREQKIHGILYFPSDYASKINVGLQTAHISLYCDMSSFLYMKNVYMSANMVMLHTMNKIQIDRYEAINMGEQMSWTLVQGAPYEDVTLFNPTGGYGTFLIPAVLVLIVHQTLFFGIGMMCGVNKEENKEVFLLPGRRRRYSIMRLLVGRGAAYFLVYLAIGAFGLVAIPHIFGLPHMANVLDMFRMMVPFLLSVIYLSFLRGAFQSERESGMVTLLFSSLILIFISGISWPVESMPTLWRYISYLIPATWGIHGFVHLNTMGATLSTTIQEYDALWLLTALYFGLCVIVYMSQSRCHERQVVAVEREQLRATLQKMKMEAKHVKKNYNKYSLK